MILEYTCENIEKLADEIINSMDFEQLQEYVYDDLIAQMINDKPTFEENAKELGYEI